MPAPASSPAARPAPSGRPRVYLHVGAPKTGTTHLQQRLRRNARALARAGLFVPRDPAWARSGADLHFRAALDLLDQDWGGPTGHARGAWGRLLRQIGEQDASAVVSHELLAPASARAVERARGDLEALGREVHLVYSARDLARALPAAWQESLKQGRDLTFHRFLRRARKGRLWFMRAFDYPAVLGRWADGLPGDQVHLVTLPPTGAPRELLWERFSAALGVDPGAAPRQATATNASLGVPEAQLLRLLNRRLGGSSHRDHRFQYVIGNLVAERVLVARESPRVQLPPDAHDWVAGLTGEWSAWARERGVDVVGDLEDLSPRQTDPTGWLDPDRLRPRMVVDAAVEALAATVDEAAERKIPLPTKLGRRVTQLLERH